MEFFFGQRDLFSSLSSSLSISSARNVKVSALNKFISKDLMTKIMIERSKTSFWDQLNMLLFLLTLIIKNYRDRSY